MKTSTQKLYGEMKPISPPVEKFSTYMMDFIGPLPTTKNQFNGIMVIVNKLTKFTSITLIKMTFSAKDIARLFFEKIVSRFGMPETLISDRDPRFTSKFWKSLWEYYQTKLALSTAYHPQTDGQTERANRTLQQVIWTSVNYHRNNWDEYLSAVEFAMNNTYQESTKTTPYMLMYGVQPKMPIDWKITVKTDAPTAKKFITEMQEALHRAHENILKAQEAQKHQSDKHHQSHKFKEGDLVLLNNKNLRIPDESAKLRLQFIGPFKIVKQMSPDNFKLDLPDNLRIHNNFHVNLLKSYILNDNTLFPNQTISLPESIQMISHVEYEVEKIIDIRRRYG